MRPFVRTVLPSRRNNPRDRNRRRNKTKRPPRQQGGLFFQGRIVLTEGKVRQNFLAKSYGPKKGGVKEILDIKCFCFQLLTKSTNTLEKSIILRYLRELSPIKLLLCATYCSFQLGKDPNATQARLQFRRAALERTRRYSER